MFEIRSQCAKSELAYSFELTNQHIKLKRKGKNKNTGEKKGNFIKLTY